MAYFCMTNYADVQAVSDAMSEITLEKINATVKLLPMDVVSYLQQMPLMLSGDEKLDTLLISQNFSMSSQIAQGCLLYTSCKSLDENTLEHSERKIFI